jgi:uncharacterized protein YcbK (DUF882 family)
MGLATPSPIPVAPFIEAAIEPVEVQLHDGNLDVSATVAIRRDGFVDVGTAAEIAYLFRCRDTGYEHAIAQGTLAMLVDLTEHWPGKPIEYLSVFRNGRGEPWESPHRAGRAIDFRIPGVALRDIRDYLWRDHREVGIGWYPYENFVHMDSRPGMGDTAWTFNSGDNHYNPYWAELARAPKPPTPSQPHKPGV